MRGEATVLHADLDAFYASVEQRDAPALRGRPVIVGGGVVLAASYEAKARGVRTAMGGRQARDLCPDAVVVPPRMDAYSAASRDVFAIFRDTTPLVEGLSIDEAFLEVGGLRRIAGTPEQIAVRLRERVRAEVGLAISVGVARTKFLAKVASAVSKPDGLLVVEPEREEAFLLPLPVERLWGVGAVTAEKLHRLGITHRRGAGRARSGDRREAAGQGDRRAPARAGPAAGSAPGRHHAAPRVDRLSARARQPPALARGTRSSSSPRSSIGSAAACATATGCAARSCCASATATSRRPPDRAPSASRPTAPRVLLAVARGLLAAAQPEIAERGITLIGVSLSQLGRADSIQPELPIDWDDGARLDTVLDAVRDRFGAASVARAAQLGRDPGWSTPLLPEHE